MTKLFYSSSSFEYLILNIEMYVDYFAVLWTRDIGRWCESMKLRHMVTVVVLQIKKFTQICKKSNFGQDVGQLDLPFKF